MSPGKTPRLFQGFGIELEYMIVNKVTLNVLPVTDQVLKAVAGEITSDVEMGELEWSNELVLHVIELKTNGPAKSLHHLAAVFHAQVQQINTLLEPMNGMLMPTAMHPWMDPYTEMRLWEHDYSPVYEAYNRIFDCRGHGWANLQSMHINLPFATDGEFGRLHAAIRLILPLLPGIAASSPVCEGKLMDFLDYRLDVYRKNQAKIPQITGQIVPEAVFTKADYEKGIFEPLYKAIQPHDPDNIMQEEWLNSRGAIARFDRNTIEIRVLDIQECPKADLAIAAFIVEVLKALIAEKWTSTVTQQNQSESALAPIFLAAAKDAEHTLVTDRHYLRQFGISEESCTIGNIWKHLFSEVMNTPKMAHYHNALNVLMYQGTLATRIRNALPETPGPDDLMRVYEMLCSCLAQNRQFDPDA